MTLVLDASMTVAWLFDDEQTDAAHAVMRRVVAEGAIVPSLWRLEVANVLRNAVRRGRCNEGFVDRSLARLEPRSVTLGRRGRLPVWAAGSISRRRLPT